ncbi:CASP8 and FADD-like apoptosis regulator [Chanos chanos]|uniref:CASP8 and FADD-like apoptosis regulator n=1 Tax=Chanos chanos TaxID=29144 RepID=A0A6J2WE66_CHACN|nr:CASP8 and FADD-like apoptosis regulator [Chanos chanos]
MSRHLSQTIHLIAEELSKDEWKRLSFLCGVTDTECPSFDVRRMLMSLMHQKGLDETFLMELMFKMRRYDILRSVLNTNRTEVERMLGNNHVLSEYRVLMADISEDMDTDDLKSLVFLLSANFPRERLSKIKSLLDVIVELERQDQMSCERMDLLEKHLRAIQRTDLARKINRYQQRGAGNVEMGNAVTYREYSQNSVDEYRMRSKPRGVCVIIDCVGIDGAYWNKTFKCLHFQVITHKLLCVRETLATLKDVARRREHYWADAFICCVISRGSATDLLGIDSHGPGLNLDTVKHLFTPECCPGLAGKPKLFFIQSYEVPRPQRCYGGAGYYDYRDADLETDGPVTSYGVETVPANADIFWSHCWTNEHQLEDQNHHSVYLQALCTSLLKGQKRKMNLVDAHMEVNRKIYEHNAKETGAKYSINLRHTLRKHVCLS